MVLITFDQFKLELVGEIEEEVQLVVQAVRENREKEKELLELVGKKEEKEAELEDKKWKLSELN